MFKEKLLIGLNVGFYGWLLFLINIMLGKTYEKVMICYDKFRKLTYKDIRNILGDRNSST